MPWVEALADAHELRRCIRDLVVLSTLPTTWKNSDPPEIANSVATALVLMLGADFVHIAIPSQSNEPIVEVTHLGARVAHDSLGAIRGVLREVLPARAPEKTFSIADPFGAGDMCIAIAPIGFGSDAMLIAGSSQKGFPSEVQRVLVGISANETTIALQRWDAEVGKRRFFALIEQSSDLIGLCSLDGQVQYINPEGAKTVGLSSSNAAIGLKIFDFLAPGDQARAREEAWAVVLRTGRWLGELGFRHFRNGATLPFLVDWFRIDHPQTGQPMNMATVSRNLTSVKRSEADLRHLNETLEQRVSERTAELKRTNQRLVTEMFERDRADAQLQESRLELWHATRLSAAGHLAGALAHELNQPLTAIINSVRAARLLLGTGVEEKISKVPEILNEVAEQALRGGQIIRRLRDFVTRGETEMRSENVIAMIEEASALALADPGALGVEVQFRPDFRAVDVLANRIQIQQVLVNLIHNALEAMMGCERRIMRISTVLIENGLVEVSVSDTGAGLGEDLAPRLFAPFVSTKHKGMGLGLSISRSIIEAHGGKIRAESNPGGGTILRFTLATTAEGAIGDSQPDCPYH